VIGIDELVRSMVSATALTIVFTALAEAPPRGLRAAVIVDGARKAKESRLARTASGARRLSRRPDDLHALVAAPRLWWLGVVDFFVHSTIDRCKSITASAYRWTPVHRLFWWSMGIDQSLHHLTGFVLAVIIASGH